jgi:cytoskeletal protein CcmA (bactofilin family)
MAESTGAAWQLMALLGEGASFEGKLVFEGRVRIDGNFRGDIVSEGTLVIGDRATVEASISVGSLIVLGGTVRGDVRAQHTVELHAPAKVFGNITAPQLAIDRGVVFEGQSRVAENEDAQPAPSLPTRADADQSGTAGEFPPAIVTPDE